MNEAIDLPASCGPGQYDKRPPVVRLSNTRHLGLSNTHGYQLSTSPRPDRPPTSDFRLPTLLAVSRPEASATPRGRTVVTGDPARAGTTSSNDPGAASRLGPG